MTLYCNKCGNIISRCEHCDEKIYNDKEIVCDNGKHYGSEVCYVEKICKDARSTDDINETKKAIQIKEGIYTEDTKSKEDINIRKEFIEMLDDVFSELLVKFKRNLEDGKNETK
jgi:hypothetical protein